MGALSGGAVQDLTEADPLLAAGTLDALLAAGPLAWAALDGLTGPAYGLSEVEAHLPFAVADLVDFYASEQHARNVGAMFRPDAPPLPKAWPVLPQGYHGRAGNVVVSGTPVRRPSGVLGPGTYGPTQRLDLEAELGFVVGVPASEPVAVAHVGAHVFGVVLLNDWSARDVQGFETVPLGPFLGKAFATSISAWVTPLASLSEAHVPAPAVNVLPHLAGGTGLDITLSVAVNGTELSRPPARTQHWGVGQLVAHLTHGGARLRTGDLLGSGTVSGPTDFGSLLELGWNGTRPVPLAEGSTRVWLQDGDEVVLTGTAPGPGGSVVELAEVRGRVLPAAGSPV